jgi:hypothetical protein
MGGREKESGKMGFYLRYPRYLSSLHLTFPFSKRESGERVAGFNGMANPATFPKFSSNLRFRRAMACHLSTSVRLAGVTRRHAKANLLVLLVKR